MADSSSRAMLMVQSSSGTVLVLNTDNSDGPFNDIPPEARVEVTQAKYGSGGGGGRVITLDKNFIIRVWTTEIASKRGKSSRGRCFPQNTGLCQKTQGTSVHLCAVCKSFARSGVDLKT